ncbi:MAG: hypothetical protein UT67_C0005G0015 [Candidatus Magasanikbacteria bacterium GW2011_GWA2_40_10]|uniref:Integral membrane protein n=1 Tax=Candidatus Magasanikbacteria bacterium GW2011_GWA2_40_10 TaxID=1619037 RepID=A0A0G0Q435_9BACT|nr:MAG: hypothetical protein UT67_C0005G0015 [Candidatus Magasanikbacteria bacterium GW2011_GWA2_40_10]
MKKIILVVYSLTLLSAVFFGTNALAVDNSQEALDQLNAAAGASGANIAGSGPTDPRIMAANIIKMALGVLGIIFVVIIVYAGFLWMTAAGEEEKTGKAKKLITNGVIGLIIILSAYAITSFVISNLVGATTGSSEFGGSNFPAPPLTE